MRAYRLTALFRWAGVLGALLLGAACSSDAASDRSASNGGNCWWCGGQTGSLTPACGVTPNAEIRGVPASAAGIVVSTELCGDPGSRSRSRWSAYRMARS